MGDGTKENPFTREDVLNLVRENGGTAVGLDLSGKVFEEHINLFGLDLSGIILKGAVFPASKKLKDLVGNMKDQMPHMGFAPLIGTSLAEVNLQGADLSHAKLSGINMRHAQLQKANLSFAQLVGTNLMLAQLQGAKLQYANLTDAYMWGADLRNADIGYAQLGGTHLRSAKMEGAYLFESQFSGADLRYVDWGNYISGEEKEKHFRMAAANYRELKLLYNSIGFYDLAGEFFYREMECKRRILHSLWLEVFRILCGYGERPFRVLVSAVVVIFGSAIAYRFGGLSLPYSIYFSFVSFTALGYGSWVPQPTGWAKGVGVAEAFVGVFMMALFLVTFTRKMTR